MSPLPETKRFDPTQIKDQTPNGVIPFLQNNIF